MSTTVFDTLAYSKRLQAAGVPQPQADAQAEALAAAVTDQLATKHDLTEVRTAIEKQIQDVISDVKVLKWIAGFNVALTAAILARLLS